MTKKNNFAALEKILKEKTESGMIPALQICVLHSGKTMFSAVYGNIANDLQKVTINTNTLFDITTLTKLFTAAAFMCLVDEEKIGLDDPLTSLFPEFQGYRQVRPVSRRQNQKEECDLSRGDNAPVDSAKITFRQLLSDSSGLPCWLPLYEKNEISAGRDEALHSYFCYQPGSEVCKSDLAYLILGWTIEKLSGIELDKALDELVIQPLKLSETGFRPTNPANKVPLPMPQDGVAPTIPCGNGGVSMLGESLDRNSAFFSGISGHSGLFSTAQDLAVFGNAFISGNTFLKAGSVFAMTHSQALSYNQACNMGLGFQLWSDDENAAFFPLSSESFGMDGCAGSALWIDPQRELVIALLNNGSQCSDGTRREKLNSARAEIVRTIVESI